ncbi:MULTISPECIES: hypothetical protein [Streptomyces]|uniref:hypothetical protein n=1 Tax=Streptomyces TaxID=1883 RepID=UPI00163BFD7C|nr:MULTISPECIES: hypothetical protein [Streptomyces]MBC2877754.1 hypothetical protein [Streptomyces sp. TYQ1024]UBI38659.1 hypothetical protein K7I03_20795 [Streptomyces mobaraensis]UKW31241.1 hypothetical protein MCU78_20750 [Streptomyces sp. TYQ1024]
MTDRAVPRRRVRARTLLGISGAVAVLALGGVWLGQGADRANAVSDAPQTARAKKEQQDQRDRASASAQFGAAQELPGVRDCGYGELLLEPKIITLSCANGGAVASDIEWDTYATDKAEGDGVVLVSSGANGSARTSFPARLTLSRPRKVDGMLAFTSVEVVYTGLTPAGKTTETYSIT